MTTLTVRTFEQSDTGAVVDLWERAFPDDPPRNAPRTMIDRKLARDPELIWVACEPGGGVVGAVMAGYDGVRGWLYHLAVDESRRRLGVATALVEHATEQLHALGCRKVNLQVRDSNRAVVAFYESLGWSNDHTTSLGRVLPD